MSTSRAYSLTPAHLGFDCWSRAGLDLAPATNARRRSDITGHHPENVAGVTSSRSFGFRFTREEFY